MSYVSLRCACSFTAAMTVVVCGVIKSCQEVNHYIWIRQSCTVQTENNYFVTLIYTVCVVYYTCATDCKLLTKQRHVFLVVPLLLRSVACPNSGSSGYRPPSDVCLWV